MSDSAGNSSKATVLVTAITVIGGIITALVVQDKKSSPDPAEKTKAEMVATVPGAEQVFRPGLYTTTVDADNEIMFIRLNNEKEVAYVSSFVSNDSDPTGTIEDWFIAGDGFAPHPYLLQDKPLYFNDGTGKCGDTRSSSKTP